MIVDTLAAAMIRGLDFLTRFLVELRAGLAEELAASQAARAAARRRPGLPLVFRLPPSA